MKYQRPEPETPTDVIAKAFDEALHYVGNVGAEIEAAETRLANLPTRTPAEERDLARLRAVRATNAAKYEALKKDARSVVKAQRSFDRALDNDGREEERSRRKRA